MMIVIRYLHSPLVQSLLLHSALLAALWLFSGHFIPELPPASAPLQATLVSSAPVPTPPEPTNTPLENTESPENNQPLAVPEPNVSPIEKQEAKEKADKEAKEQKIAKEKADKEQKAREEARKKLQETLSKNSFDKEMAALEGKIKAEKEAQLRKEAALSAQKEAERLAKERADKEAKDKLNQEQVDLADKYKKRIYETIKREWSIPPKSADLSAQVRIVLLPVGEVRSILFLKCSGKLAFDAITEPAINKASPLPVPSDAALFNQFRSVTFNFSSKD